MALDEVTFSPANGVEYTRHCYILELPAELRLQIYGFLLSPETIEITSYDEHTFMNTPYDEAARTRYYAHSNGGSLQPQLLNVCRQVYYKALPMLYHPIELQLEPARSAYSRPKFRPFPLDRLEYISVLQELYIDLVTLIETKLDDVAHSLILAKHLCKDLRVERLRLSFGADDSGKWVETSLQGVARRMISS